MATLEIHAVVGDVTFSPPSEQRALLNVAISLIPGAKLLATETNIRPEALVLLLGHITECLLKCIAFQSEKISRQLRSNSNNRHNLEALWHLAANKSSAIPKEPPPWIEALNKFHNTPFVSRYMKDVAFYSPPATEPMLNGVIQLHALAEAIMRETGQTTPVA